MSDIEKIRQEIERLKQMGSIGLNEYDAGFENGRGELCDELLAFIDSLPEDDLPKTKGWVARNKDESLVFCYHKPHRENSITQEWWGSCDADFRIYDDTIDEQFKDIKWEDEPVRVEIAVKRLDSLPEDHFRDSTKMISKEQKEEVPPYCTGVKEDPDPPGINDLEEAAEDSWMLYEYRETPQGLYSSCYRDGFIAGAKWMESQMPMPEDTVIFMKGVEEGRRLEREDRNDDNLPRYYGD